MFLTEFDIFDQGRHLVFIRKKGNLGSYHGCRKGAPAKEGLEGRGQPGHSSLGVVSV